MQWFSLPFSELTTHQLYELLQLRVDVFIVEQNCPYSELDGLDHQPGVEHLLGYKDDKLVAYARLMPPELVYPEDSAIGRVIVHKDVRGNGMGVTLIKKAIVRCNELWSERAITIGAQAHLEKYYNSVGFQRISDVYLEDGIPHIKMRKAPIII